jgi:Zn-dependent protease with chaperone function
VRSSTRLRAGVGAELVLDATIVASAVAVATGLSALLVPRRMRPDKAARLIIALVLLSLGGAVWALLLVALDNIAQLHGVAERLAWCSGIVLPHRDSPSPVGVVALGAVVAATASVVRVRIRQRRQSTTSDERELAIVASAEPFAYSLPGRPGQVVVSTGMLRSLDPQERRVLIAHEQSHLRRRHHRYVRATELAVAAMPMLAPVSGRLRFAVERWADEDAAVEIGDRATVASAIARAALASQSSPRLGLAIADAGVVERVQIMLAGPARRSPVIESLLGVVIVGGLGGLVASLLLVPPWVHAALGLCR